MIDSIERVLTDDEAREILQKPYERYNLQYLLNKVLIPDFQFRNNRIEHKFDDLFGKITEIGGSKSLNLAVYEVNLQKDAYKRRIKITQRMFSILRDYLEEYSLVIFDPGDGTYRLSLLTCSFEYDEESCKIINTFSNPRRFSYSLGVGAKTKTPFEFLIKKGVVNSASDLLDRFSVEIANKQFYDEIALKYTQLVGGERSGVQYPGVLKIESASEMPAGSAMIVEFAVRLIGRIIFCKFLCEVKSANGIPLMNAWLFTKETILDSDGNYYQNILVPLFFSVLNTKESDRHQKVTSDQRFAGIPYLNGGLFNPQIDDGFEDQKSNRAALCSVQIPNSWFLEFFDILNQYNFIVDENTSYDVELSIDPEMLGRIFENLLAEINPETGGSARKSTGSFYTPREIVDYMVDSTLLEYLKVKTDIPGEILENLITYNKNENLIALTYAEKENVINYLFSLSVLDPACGSGAFPIGVLQKVVYILQELDPNAEMWVNMVCKGATSIFRQEIRKKFEINALDYIRKLSVLQNSIFGVDIQPIAVEIARLRCFLSLVIEEKVLDNEPNRGILPLPNLDFKFVAANTLVKLDTTKQMSFFENKTHMDALNRIRDEYFNADCASRTELRNNFYNIQSAMINETTKNYHGVASKRHEQLSNWNPFENNVTNWFDPHLSFGIEAFDIVIANPPYVQLKYIDQDKIKDIIAGKKKPEYITYTGSGDIYLLFYERGLTLLKENGFLTYITSNKWMRAAYGESLRNYFVKYANPIRIIDLGAGRFKSATVDTNIIMLQNAANKHKTRAIKYTGVNLSNLSAHIMQNEIDMDFVLDENWIILSPVERTIKKKVELAGVPLKEWDIKINCGIITGCNDAFFVDQTTRDTLVSQVPKSDEIMKPILRGRDIIRGGHRFANIYVIATHDGYYDSNNNYVAPINIEHYPNIKEYFDKLGPKFKNRPEQGVTPYNLRSCKYMHAFSKQKIIYSDIAQGPQFYFDTDGKFMVEASAFIMTGSHLEYLANWLNSSLVTWIFKRFYAGGGLGNTGFRYKKAFIEKLPIPMPLDDKVIYTDEEIAKLYGFDSDEIDFIYSTLYD